MVAKTLAERFAERTRPADGGCLLWTGARTRNGYGTIGVGGRTRYVHRLAWEMANGPIPAGGHVLHRCDTPACVNAAHLFLGDQAANMRDMAAKGRAVGGTARGESHGVSKLREVDVRSIRRLRAKGLSVAAIADRFGISKQNVGFIVRRQTWAHVV